MVYVLALDDSPLMPCCNVIARLLLKENKARVVHRTPFTIKLNYVTEATYTQPLTLGIDTGSDKIGSAVVADTGNVLYTAEIKIRNDIADKMKRRSMYRRNRRGRKTRYRAPKFLNRGNSTKSGRFSTTMRSKIDAHLKEIKFVESILTVSKIIIETGSFDPHALKNPDLLLNTELYQKGTNYGFANTKAYVLDRDTYVCQNCGGKSKEQRLEVHHIVYRSDGGADSEDNLITLCKCCHDDVHKGVTKLSGGKKKGKLKHATQMNSIRKQLLLALPEAIETYGYVTKENRQMLGLDKSHINDAVVIAGKGYSVTNEITPLIKVNKSHGEYMLTEGSRSQKVMPRRKICGFRVNDKVKYKGGTYFVKGRMSTGYCTLMNISGDKQVFDKPKTVKFCNLIRLQASGTQLCL
jgi:hypothetical protein